MTSEPITPPPDGSPDAVALANLGLVYRHARRGAHRLRGAFDADDAVQEGYLGLRHAALRYDPGRDAKFSTVAVPWIRQAVQRAQLKQAHAVAVPTWAQDYVRYGCCPDSCRNPALLAANAAAARRAMAPTATAEFDMDGLGDPGPTAVDARDAVAVLLGALPPHARLIVRLRYGLAGDPPIGQAELAGLLGVSHSAMQRAERKALAAMREAAAKGGLVDA